MLLCLQVYLFVCLFAHLFALLFVRSFVYWFVRSLVRRFARSFVHLFVRSLFISFITLFLYILQVYVLKKEEGGRHTPFFTNYTPQMFVRTGDVAATITLPDGVEMVMPGDNEKLTLSLRLDVPLEVGLRFTLREGGRTVGTGIVTEILE